MKSNQGLIVAMLAIVVEEATLNYRLVVEEAILNQRLVVEEATLNYRLVVEEATLNYRLVVEEDTLNYRLVLGLSTQSKLQICSGHVYPNVQYFPTFTTQPRPYSSPAFGFFISIFFFNHFKKNILFILKIIVHFPVSQKDISQKYIS